jgi:integrase/recombinase XerD
MLSRFFEASARIEAIHRNPSGVLIEKFADYLSQHGYAEITARRHIRSAEHVAFWSDRRGFAVDELDDTDVRRFGEHLARCRCCRFARTNRLDILAGARLFLGYLHGCNEPVAHAAKPAELKPPLLKAFDEWMHAQRGTSDQTLYNYSLPIRALLRRLGNDLRVLDAHHLRQFVLIQSRGAGWAAAKRCTTALRMFVRFLIAEGRCRAGLLGAVPVLAHWRLASLPRYLPPEDVERIIDSCDLSTPAGKRDRAILLLLARLGLRAGDIVQMRLQDIDWKEAWIHVSGKNRRQTRLPLSQEVGRSIVQYLQEARPQAGTDALFLRCHAPFRALRSHCAVSVLVASAMRRAGIERQVRGAAHLLRHSVASSMLRHGASLQDISALLRHRSVETTQIYAKVDITGLAQIAQRWPEVKPC